MSGYFCTVEMNPLNGLSSISNPPEFSWDVINCLPRAVQVPICPDEFCAGFPVRRRSAHRDAIGGRHNYRIGLCCWDQSC